MEVELLYVGHDGPYIMALVKLDLDLAYFQWRGLFYKQLKGFGMGKSTSSPLSYLYGRLRGFCPS